jgi:hypothetical protein
MHYFIYRLLYRISVSPYADNFILKRELLLYGVLDVDARATKDIDFLAIEINNGLDELKKIFILICTIPADDAVLFDINSIVAERIKEDAMYEGVRLKSTSYLDKSRHVLQFDIGFGDIVVSRPSVMVYPSILEIDKPKIKAYSLESVIAEKFEAMSFLAEAMSQTFMRRATPLTKEPTVFSEDFFISKEKQTQWNAFKKRTGVKICVEFTEILTVIKLFLLSIYQCVIDEREFFGEWDFNICEWTKHFS